MKSSLAISSLMMMMMMMMMMTEMTLEMSVLYRRLMPLLVREDFNGNECSGSIEREVFLE
jgi:hypothetical protein